MEPSFVTAASPPPSYPPSTSVLSPALRTYVEPAGRSIGLFRMPTPLAGQKHSLTPSPPSSAPAVLPTSPPPIVGQVLIHQSVPADWRDWIRSRHEASQKTARVSQEDLDVAAAALASSSPPPSLPPPLLASSLLPFHCLASPPPLSVLFTKFNSLLHHLPL